MKIDTQEITNLSTKKETASALRVCDRTVDTLVAIDAIPSVQIGNRRLFFLPDVLNAIRETGSVSTQPKQEEDAAAR